jgi:hypothetical protein
MERMFGHLYPLAFRRAARRGLSRATGRTPALAGA